MTGTGTGHMASLSYLSSLFGVENRIIIIMTAMVSYSKYYDCDGPNPTNYSGTGDFIPSCPVVTFLSQRKLRDEMRGEGTWWQVARLYIMRGGVDGMVDWVYI